MKKLYSKCKAFLDRTLLKNRLKTIQVGNFPLLTPRNNLLDFRLRKYKNYSRNLPRLVSFVCSYYNKPVKVIDVGANVGDTIALIREKVDCPILAIEGNTEFYDLLLKNTSGVKNISTANVFLGETEETSSKQITADSKGTSRLTSSAHQKMNITTLDAVLETNSPFKDAGICKIDTDGYDFAIIRGAKKYVEKTQPILFIEYEREFLEAKGEDYISTLRYLESIGYSKIIFYDNYGRYILMTDLKNEVLIQDLYYYSGTKQSAIAYYDICIFPKAKDEIALAFSREESGK